LAGLTPATLTPRTTAARTGFETAIDLAGQPVYVSVQALSASGQVLGRSATVAVAAG
jgi:hypothetical protein